MDAKTKTAVAEAPADATAPAPEPKKGKGGKKKSAPKTDVVVEATADPEPSAKPAPKQKKGKDGLVTLSDVAEGYLESLQADGSETTIASYRAELKRAAAALGSDTVVADLTARRVSNYFESDAVTKKKNGKDKGPLTVDKTRRVLRLALCWAVQEGLIEKAPLPE